jgi:hypothetical protein
MPPLAVAVSSIGPRPRSGIPTVAPGAVAPVIAEIEDVLELVTRLDLPGDLQLRVVKPHHVGLERVVGKADQTPVGQGKTVQMRQIPPSERGIDRLSEHLERMRRTNNEDPTRRWVAVDPPTTKKIHPDLQPRPRHPASLRRY